MAAAAGASSTVHAALTSMSGKISSESRRWCGGLKLSCAMTGVRWTGANSATSSISQSCRAVCTTLASRASRTTGANVPDDGWADPFSCRVVGVWHEAYNSEP